MIKRILLSLISLIIFTSIIQSQQLKKITFVPHWVPQTQFAGYYVAKDLGIYEKYGIDLTIIPGGPKVSSSALLEKDKVDFALMWLSNAIQLKARNSRIVNIAQIVNRSALMLISKKSSGIKTPQDMNGKKVGIWGGDFQIQPTAFFKNYNLNVKTIMQGNSINLFFFDGIDVTSAMWYNEYHTILNSGFNKDELNTFFFADYGLNFPEEGIYCSEKFYNANPEICKSFIEATLEGWKYAFNHPEEAIQIIQKHIRMANLPTNKAHQRWMLDKMHELIFPSKKMDSFEKLSEQNYLLVATKLKEGGLIKKIPEYDSLYKPVMLEKIK
jgi:NitT/TauT family transport system substrate-binding protein